jgi:dihydroorotase
MADGALIIRGGRLVDPAAGRDETTDLLVEKGKVSRIGTVPVSGGKAREIDASGKWVLPGLVDLHVHLREPGYEYKETILSGTQAAAAGGFTSVACMPNTDPVNDNPAVTRTILEKAAAAAGVRVYPVGCLTAGQNGSTLAEIGSLVEAGCRAFSDDGHPVSHPGVMRRAMEYCRSFDVPVISHCEDRDLAGDGVMHEGAVSTRLGLPPLPAAAEEVMAARDIILCRLTGARLHLAHVSTRGTVRLIEAAREEGLAVTAEVTPHHLFLTDEAVAGFDTSTKVNPPLRAREDVEAVRAALRDGVIDIIATDHAPHSPVEKEVDYQSAAFGLVGLETALGLVLKLVHEGILPLTRAVQVLTAKPAEILGVPGGTLGEGEPADLIIVDPEAEWTVTPEDFLSKGRNTPFAGWKLRGRVERTFVAGRAVYEAPSGSTAG